MKIQGNSIGRKGNRRSKIGDDAVLDQQIHGRETAPGIDLRAAKSQFHGIYLLL